MGRLRAAETVAGIDKLVHAYTATGVYVVRLSDDIADLHLTTSTAGWEAFASMVTGFASNAVNLVSFANSCFIDCAALTDIDLAQASVRTLGKAAFWRCTSRSGRIDLPSVREVVDSTSFSPFKGCTGGITEIHFAKESEAAITATSIFKADPTLGSGTGVVLFDL